MRIVHLYKDAWPPVLGGIERMLWWLAVRQARDGHEVTLLVAKPQTRSMNEGETPPARETIDGVSIRRMTALARPGGTPICPGMSRALRRLKPDLVHLHHPQPSSDLTYLLGGKGTPLAVTWHSDVVRQKRLYNLYKPMQQRMLRAARLIMPTSQRYLDSSEQLAPYREKCRVVPLGVEPLEYEEPEGSSPLLDLAEKRAKGLTELGIQTNAAATEEGLIVFVGVLRYYKGLHILLNAAAQMRKKPLFMIVGAGPEIEALRAQAADLNLGEQARFLGRRPDSDVAALHRLSDIYVMPSHLRAEAFGLSMVEAMHAGLPCVACALDSGVPEVNEHEKTGLIVPPDNPAALAEALDQLLTDPALRQRLGAGAQAKAREEYTVDRFHARVNEAYREAGLLND